MSEKEKQPTLAVECAVCEGALDMVAAWLAVAKVTQALQIQSKAAGDNGTQEGIVEIIFACVCGGMIMWCVRVPLLALIRNRDSGLALGPVSI